MVLIDRVFQNKELGNLISKIQSASIRNGNELEKIIINLVERDESIITNIDEFLEFNYVIE